MIERTDRRLGLKPDLLAADSAYGTGKFLAWLIDRKIAPHVSVRDLSRRKDGTFSRADFRYDKDKTIFTCPAGKTLKTTGRVHDGSTIQYRAIKARFRKAIGEVWPMTLGQCCWVYKTTDVVTELPKVIQGLEFVDGSEAVSEQSQAIV